MTVSNTTSFVGPSQGDGSTTNYVFNKRFDEDDEIVVVHRLRATPFTETIKTLNADYSIVGSGPPYLSGATISHTTAPPSTVDVLIYRQTPIAQPTQFAAQPTLPTTAIEETVDRNVMTLQEMQDKLNRQVQRSPFVSTDFDLTLPPDIDDTDNAGKALIINTTADGFTLSESNIDEVVADASASATAAAASAAAAASSASSAATSATNSATSASSASTSASSASTSASSASTSATNAAASATSAAGSATAAEAAQTAAEAAQAATEAVFSDGDKGDLTVSSSGTVWTIDNGVVTLAKMANIATDRLIGRDTAGTGVPEALTVGGGIEFTGTGGIQTSALTGDVTKSAGGTATTIANDAVTTAKILDANVTLAKMANIATDSFIGRDTAGTGVPEVLSVATVKTLLNLTGTNSGDQSVFGTIAVSGQSDVVADAANDTLTLVAGSNMTITTNAAGDSITFASSGGGGGSAYFDDDGGTPAVAPSAGGLKSIAIGDGASTNAVATDALAFGTGAGAHGLDSISIGLNATVALTNTQSSMAIGSGASVESGSRHSIAIGDGAGVLGGNADDALAIGSGAFVRSDFGVVLGDNANDGTYTGGSENPNSVVIGDAAHITDALDAPLGSGGKTVVIGSSAAAGAANNGNYTYQSTVVGADSVAYNRYGTVLGAGSVAGNSTGSDYSQDTALGAFSAATGGDCVALGPGATADTPGMMARGPAGGGSNAAANGQWQHYVLYARTTDGTPTEVSIPSIATSYLTIPSGVAMMLDIMIIGADSSGNCGVYRRQVGIKNVGGTTSLIGSVSTVGTDQENTAGWDVAITADNANDRLAITVTGAAATTINWTVVAQGPKVKF